MANLNYKGKPWGELSESEKINKLFGMWKGAHKGIQNLKRKIAFLETHRHDKSGMVTVSVLEVFHGVDVHEDEDLIE